MVNSTIVLTNYIIKKLLCIGYANRYFKRFFQMFVNKIQSNKNFLFIFRISELIGALIMK